MVKYLGGKNRTADRIVPVLEDLREGRPYLEPFVGGAWIASALKGKRVCSDLNWYLIEMWKKAQDGWLPPPIMPERLFDQIKANPDDYDPALVGFAGVVCTYGAKWFGTYARSRQQPKLNYAVQGRNSLSRQIQLLPKSEVKFECKDYRKYNPVNHLIYCDPPYRGVSQGYGCMDGTFNSDEFWEIMREWSERNVVVISEYEAPDDFDCILEIPTKTCLIRRTHGEIQSHLRRIERLFRFKQPKRKPPRRKAQ